MKPMLATAVTDLNAINYPVLVSPKLDGIRALVVDGVVLSRSLKPIPNKYVQATFGKRQFNGLDGELIVGSPTAPDVFQTTSSGVMRIEGTPKVVYHVFDTVPENISTDFGLPKPFSARYAAARILVNLGKTKMALVPHIRSPDLENLLTWQNHWESQGYEGLMVRDPVGEYKYGRSTLRQGWLLKVKKFEDSEAIILSVDEAMRNDNVATVGELGQSTRTSHQANKVGKGMLGAMNVIDIHTKVKFAIGTGFTEKQRIDFYTSPILGQVIKYKFQPAGVKDKPRFPVFLGFRDPIDIG